MVTEPWKTQASVKNRSFDDKFVFLQALLIYKFVIIYSKKDA